MAKKATKAAKAPAAPKAVAKPLQRINADTQRQQALYEAAQRGDTDEFTRLRDGR